MGRKKPATVDESSQGGGGGGVKSKKKNRGVVDDDEYSIGAEVSEDQSQNSEQLDSAPAPAPAPAPTAAGKKKGKKGGGGGSAKRKDDDEDEEKEKEDVEAPVVFTGKKKPNKSKKSNTTSLFSASNFDVLDENDKGSEVDDDEPVVVVDNNNNNKKSSKSKKSNGVFSASTFDAFGDDDEEEGKEDDGDDGDDVPVIQFTGKKKSSKSSKKSGSGSASASLSAASAFDGLDDEDENKEEDEDEMPAITFTGKKKKSSKKSNSLFSSALIDEAEEEGNGGEGVSAGNDGDQEDDDVPAITFSGKKKSSKSKKNKAGLDTVEETSDAQKHSDEVAGNNDKDVAINNQGSEEVAQSSKNKKKKKKSGRTAQEEDDLDKILAELGETAPAPKTTSEDNTQLQTEPIDSSEVIVEKKEAESETMESAAAKKKKKKKEKEKEKKAAASSISTAAPVNEKEDKVETKSKGAAKKLPKHVIEMQEALARRRELEEKLKKEEEEKLRKEEEERRQKEEEERLAEEAKRRKKEREKEKLLKKKQEGKLLTAKQKEEARRREAMRNQFLANSSGVLPTTETTAATTKRPKYQTKKSKQILVQVNGVAPEKPEDALDTKQNHQDVVAEVDTVEVDKDEELEGTEKDAEQKPEVGEGMEGNKTEEEDEEDWDAKSWDEADLNLGVKSAFEEEDEEEEEVETAPVPVPVVKKEKHATKPAESIDAPPVEGRPSLASREGPNPEPVKRENAESKEVQQESHPTNKNKRKDAGSSRDARSAEAHAKRSADDLRSPICCIMGHVDTGKTKLLDCIRRTNVQEGEAGGITQQIGATYFPAENIRERTKELKADATLRVPGLLVIDTPGHESFTNLRSRGSGLCDIAILVVDIMHGLEPQTIESLNLLKMRNTEFIVALNKVDRLYGWKTIPNAPIVKAMKQQTNDVQNEFKMRLIQIVTQFKEQGLNTELYYKNKEMGETFSIVPTSAISGEGIPDLLLLLVQWTQKTMTEKLMFSDEIQCTVLEVKVIEGLGTTIDVVLVNGVLHEGDQIVVCGMQGAIVTTIRALLTPHPMKELRIKGTYLHHKEIKAAQGIKITAQGLENAVPGTALYVVGPDDDLQEVMDTAEQDMNSVLSRIDKSGEGVCVQASTLGSLEALLEFLKSPAVKIPVSGISIGPVHKKDVMKASVMLEKKKEYATILAFDVKVTPEARELAEESGVKIFIADIIYHLFDQFKAYIDNLKEEKKKEAAEEAVFPCVLKIMPNCVFNKKDPIVLGVDVLEGLCKVGTPICIPSREYIDIGRIASIEVNHKQVDIAKKGQKVAIKITGTNAEEQQKMYGRHFEIEDELVSHITRTSIDVLKANYREDLSIEDWKLVVKLKNLFQIP